MKLVALLIFIIFYASPNFAQKYLFYLHGKILEDQGINAIDTINGYGKYQYEDILNTFRKKHFIVFSEVREKIPIRLIMLIRLQIRSRI